MLHLSNLLTLLPLRGDTNDIFLSWLCVNALRCPKTNSLSHKPIHQKCGLNQVEWHLFRCNEAKLMRKKNLHLNSCHLRRWIYIQTGNLFEQRQSSNMCLEAIVSVWVFDLFTPRMLFWSAGLPEVQHVPHVCDILWVNITSCGTITKRYTVDSFPSAFFLHNVFSKRGETARVQLLSKVEYAAVLRAADPYHTVSLLSLHDARSTACEPLKLLQYTACSQRAYTKTPHS